MDTKFSSDYWSHPQVENAASDIKLAGAWMRTNDRLTLFGYAAVTAERFAFETGLPKETLARTLQALSEWFTTTPKGYFVPGHIGEQIGRNDSLLNNNICKGLLRGLEALHDAEISELVLTHYPELRIAMKVLPPSKPFTSPPAGVGEERRGEEQSSAERSGAEGGAGGNHRHPNGSHPPPAGRRRADGARTPAHMAEPMRARVLELNLIFKRSAEDAWSQTDIAALDASGLLLLPESDFADQLAAVRTFYSAKIPHEMQIAFRRRTTLQKLLGEWSSELDKARQWVRDNSDGLRRT